MKTALKAISLLLAVGFTGALFAEFAGVSLGCVARRFHRPAVLASCRE